jgi:hypothetical protein
LPVCRGAQGKNGSHLKPDCNKGKRPHQAANAKAFSATLDNSTGTKKFSGYR